MKVEIIQRELIYIWYFFDVQFRQIAGYWILGIVIGSFVSVFLKKYIHERMVSLQNRRFGVWGVLPASALGILSPLCMYGTVPIAASFSKNGPIPLHLEQKSPFLDWQSPLQAAASPDYWYVCFFKIRNFIVLLILNFLETVIWMRI